MKLLGGLSIAVLIVAAIASSASAHTRPLAPAVVTESAPAPAPATVAARTVAAATEAPGPAWSAMPDAPRVPWTLLVVAAGMLTGIAWRPRTAVAVLTIAVVAVFAFEGQLHSVHHLGDRSGSHCVTAGVSGHLSSTTVDYVAVELRPVASSGHVTPSSPDLLPSSSPRPAQGRAPPSDLA